MTQILPDEGAVEFFTEKVWRLIILSCFGHCRDFGYNIFWDSDAVFDSLTKTFTFANNLYAMLRRVARGMYHTVNQLWLNRRGFSIAPPLVLARHELVRYFGPIANIIAAHFNQPAASRPIENYDMKAAKELMEDENRVFSYFESIKEAESFLSRFNTDMLYRGLTCLLDQLLRFDDPASIESSNHVAQLLIYGFFRDVEGGYCGGGLRNSDASVQLIFGVLKRILATDRLLPAWTWTQLLPLLFEYAPHVQQWKDMQGFKMFCYLMYQKTDQPSWDLCSHCIYYAASEMEEVTVNFVDSNEFGELLTSMLTRIAPIWQDNTAVLLSLARLLAAWRLQYPDLEAPANLDLPTVVGSACNIEFMGLHVLPQPLAIDFDKDAFVQDARGYVYGMSPDLEGHAHLSPIDSGFYDILHTEECLHTPEFHLQVFNSFVLWLLSRFPASQLGAHAEAIRNRMRIWECATGCGSGEDASYITDLKRKLPADLFVSADLKRKLNEM